MLLYKSRDDLDTFILGAKHICPDCHIKSVIQGVWYVVGKKAGEVRISEVAGELKLNPALNLCLTNPFRVDHEYCYSVMDLINDVQALC